LQNQDLKAIVLEILGELTETEIIEDKIVEPINGIFNMMSCKSAIKFGDELTYDGMVALINDLEKNDNKYTCVHGRPCVIELSFDELEKKFKRR
jgi:DNA mismatch repair protein MutL